MMIPTTGAKSTRPARNGNFPQRCQQSLCGRVHIIPERMFPEIDVGVQQVQHEQRGGDKFPDEITAQPDDQRFLEAMRGGNRFGYDCQPDATASSPATSPRHMIAKGQDDFRPARPAVNPAQLHPHQPVNRFGVGGFAGQKRKQQQPQHKKFPASVQN